MGADIVIATPGRLLSHIKLGTVDLSKVSFFVLDEADRMLDMGFYDDIMQVHKQLPPYCQIQVGILRVQRIELCLFPCRDGAALILKNEVALPMTTRVPPTRLAMPCATMYSTSECISS